MTERLEIERRLTLPPARCFALWADPAALAAWWEPRDESGTPFRAEVLEWRAEPGAPWKIRMLAPDGTEFLQGGRMVEVAAPHLIRFTFAWIEDGRAGPETEITVRFDADGTGTRLSFVQSGFDDAASRDGHAEGWAECLDRFVAAVRDGHAA